MASVRRRSLSPSAWSSSMAARTSSLTFSTLWLKSKLEVSTRVTPSGASRNWETLASSRSRRSTWSRRAAASTLLPAASSWAARRSRRASSEAVISRRTWASGAITVVMSRPSATMPPLAAPCSINSRWRRPNSARTSKFAAILETTAEICGSRMAWAISVPSTLRPGWSGSVSMCRGIEMTASLTPS